MAWRQAPSRHLARRQPARARLVLMARDWVPAAHAVRLVIVPHGAQAQGAPLVLGASRMGGGGVSSGREAEEEGHARPAGGVKFGGVGGGRGKRAGQGPASPNLS